MQRDEETQLTDTQVDFTVADPLGCREAPVADRLSSRVPAEFFPWQPSQ